MFENRRQFEATILGRRIVAVDWNESAPDAVWAFVLEDGKRIELSGSCEIDDATVFAEVANA